jgi:hypothetical protein
MLPGPSLESPLTIRAHDRTLTFVAILCHSSSFVSDRSVTSRHVTSRHVTSRRLCACPACRVESSRASVRVHADRLEPKWQRRYLPSATLLDVV